MLAVDMPEYQQIVAVCNRYGYKMRFVDSYDKQIRLVFEF